MGNPAGASFRPLPPSAMQASGKESATSMNRRSFKKHISQPRAPKHALHAAPPPASQNNQNTVVFRGRHASDTLRRCHVRGNFVVSSGRKLPGGLSAGLTVQGAAPPALVSSTVAFQVGSTLVW